MTLQGDNMKDDLRHIWEVIINLNRITGSDGTELLNELYEKHKAIEKKKGVPVEIVVRISRSTEEDIDKAVECCSDPKIKKQMKAFLMREWKYPEAKTDTNNRIEKSC